MRTFTVGRAVAAIPLFGGALTWRAIGFGVGVYGAGATLLALLIVGQRVSTARKLRRATRTMLRAAEKFANAGKGGER